MPYLLSPAWPDLPTTLPATPRPEFSALELQWHQRRVEAFGILLRISVPLLGGPAPALTASVLSDSLSRLWGGRSLSVDVVVHSVLVEVQRREDGDELVLLISTDHLPRDHSIVGVRMARDLRSALRTMRQPSAGGDLAAVVDD